MSAVACWIIIVKGMYSCFALKPVGIPTVFNLSVIDEPRWLLGSFCGVTFV